MPLYVQDGGDRQYTEPRIRAADYHGGWTLANVEVVTSGVTHQHGSLLCLQSYKFEEVQQLRVDVYDVDTPFVNSAPERLELSKQELQVGRLAVHGMPDRRTLPPVPR